MTAVKTEPAGNLAQLSLLDLSGGRRWPKSNRERVRLYTEVFVDEPSGTASKRNKTEHDNRCAPHLDRC
jgi:hypothetical protein